MNHFINMINVWANQITRKKGFKTDRVKALVDGIFGIAMTLLVLAVKESAGQGQEFWAQFQPILETLFPYVVSFLILGIYWTGHPAQFYQVHDPEAPVAQCRPAPVRCPDSFWAALLSEKN